LQNAVVTPGFSPNNKSDGGQDPDPRHLIPDGGFLGEVHSLKLTRWEVVQARWTADTLGVKEKKKIKRRSTTTKN